MRLLGWEFYKHTKLRIPVQKRSCSFVKNLRYQVLGCSLGSAVLYSQPLLILSYCICKRVLCSWKEDQEPSQVSHCKMNRYGRNYPVILCGWNCCPYFCAQPFQKA